MQLKDFVVKHFKDVTEVKVSFGSGVTFLVGDNGQGKTSLADAIFTMLLGKGFIPIRDREGVIQKGAEKAVLSGTLIDDEKERTIEVTRTITDKGVYLKVESSDGAQLGEEFLKSIISPFSINPLGFAELDPKEQAIMLGVDTSKFDEKYKKLYDERTLAGREKSKLEGSVKLMKEKGQDEKAEPVDTIKLLEERQNILEFNDEQEERKNNLEVCDVNIVAFQQDIERLKGELKLAENHLKEARETKKNSPEPEPLKSTDEIDFKLKAIDETNAKANAYNEYLKEKQKLKDKDKEYMDFTEKLHKIQHEKTEFVKKQELPYSNIAIDDEGGLMVDGKYLNKNHFAWSELLTICIKILKEIDPELKWIYVAEANLLGEAKMDEVKKLAEDGYQFLLEYVGTQKMGDSCILIKEQKIVDSYEDDKTEGGPVL